MDEIRSKASPLKLDTSSFNTINVSAKKDQAKVANIMFQGKNIHSSPLDGKLLCSYSEKLCKQRRLNGYAFCIRHVLEDKNAPFKQCQFVAKYNGHQCTNPIPFAEDRIYCNSHLQVLGIVPKKNRRKKPGEGNDGDANSSSLESKSRTDVLPTPATTNVLSLPPQVFSFRPKKPRNQPTKKVANNPAVEEWRESRKKWRRDTADLFTIYGIDSSDGESSSENDDMPWQQMWLSSDTDLDQEAYRKDGTSLNSDPRTAKISRLSAQLRRQLHQLRRTLRTRRYQHNNFVNSGCVLVKAIHNNTSACVDSLLENSNRSRKNRSRPSKCMIKSCAFSEGAVQCTAKALPYTKFCADHIMNDSKQVLYAQCTAKWPGGLQCSVPVFDVVHERPLCEEHARKKAKFQEAQAQAQAAAAAAKSSPGSNKQLVKKPRRKPQPKAALPLKAAKSTKRPASKKPPLMRTNKAKVAKTVNNSLRPTGGLSDSFSPENPSDVLSPGISMSLSSDYSHSSDPSPVSPSLGDFQHYDPPMFDSQRREEMLFTAIDREESRHDILSTDFELASSETTPGKSLYRMEGKVVVDDDNIEHSVPTSVITHTPGMFSFGLAGSNGQRSPAKPDARTKSSPLNSRSKNAKASKPKDTRNQQNLGSMPTHHSVANILSTSIHADSVKKDKSTVKELTLIRDPMFSPPHGLLSGSDLKSHSNGVNSEHLHSPSQVGLSMDSLLSPAQRPWPAIVSNTSPASASYTSPLNSTQTGISRLVSPPFSPTSLSPHISPHVSIGNVFTFDRSSHFQQSHLTSPGLSPSFLQGQAKQSLPPYQRHGELDHNGGHDNDPFLFPVDREQSLFGTPFTQSHDTSLGDLRLR